MPLLLLAVLLVALPFLLYQEPSVFVERSSLAPAEMPVRASGSDVLEPRRNQIEHRGQTGPRTSPPTGSSQDAPASSRVAPQSAFDNAARAKQLLGTAAEYLDAATYSGPDAEVRFAEYVDQLRVDREASARYLNAQLESLSPEELLSDRGQALVYVIGLVCHRSSVDSLMELLLLDSGSSDSERCSEISDVSILQTFAVQALDMIAGRYNSAEIVRPIVSILEQTLSSASSEPQVKIAAARVLMAHSSDPTARSRELAVLMGDDAKLLDITVRRLRRIP